MYLLDRKTQPLLTLQLIQWIERPYTNQVFYPRAMTQMVNIRRKVKNNNVKIARSSYNRYVIYYKLVFWHQIFLKMFEIINNILLLNEKWPACNTQHLPTYRILQFYIKINLLAEMQITSS